MLSLVFRDANGIEQAYAKRIYDLNWSATEKGGPLSLTAAVPIDVLAPKLSLLQDVSLYDGLEEIWLGRIREMPSVSRDGQAAIVLAEGYINHLDEGSMVPRYLDTRLGCWEPREAFSGLGSNANPSHFLTDNYSRVGVGLTNGQAYALNDAGGLVYKATADTIVRFAADYATNYDNTKCYAQLYAWNGSAWTEIWRRDATGTGTGTIDISTTTTPSGYVLAPIPANCSAVMWRLRAASAHTNTSGDNVYYGRLTYPKVYYKTLSDWKTTTVLKDILGLVAPSLSTDYSKITSGTYTLSEFFDEEKTPPLELLRRLNSFEGYDYGVWDRDPSKKPRLTFAPHALNTVHYVTSLDGGRPELAGDSIESQYNFVDVEYQDKRTGKNLVTTVTRAHALLDSYGIDRSPAKITLRGTSSSAASQVGNTFLNDKARPQGKGSLTVRGYVWTGSGTRTPAHRIRPGTNILVRDLRASNQTLKDATSSNVLNGTNIFRVVQVDARPWEATLQLDNEGDRLDFILARKALG